MSSVNAPQPDATGPAEVFDSTASAPHGTTISAIGTPAGPPQETPMHTGQMNTFDDRLHQQYVPTDIVTWSVTMTSGTLMWKKPIHPQFAHPGLAYLAGLYNTWSGSLDFNFKVAGTGFHAGAIAIVRIPPNRRPEDFSTPSQWGLFEYVVIDPKTLEVESLGVSDQRPIAYHYMNFDEKLPNTFGGWIAMYTMLPLNTSATGSQQISIQVFNRPGINFQFSQLIMPTNTPTSIPFPSCFLEYFDFSSKHMLTTFPVRVNSIVIEPSKVTTTTAVLNCYTTQGKMMSKWNEEEDYIDLDERALLQCSALDGTDESTDPLFAKVIKPLGVPKVDTPVTFSDLDGENGSVFYATKVLKQVEYNQYAKNIQWKMTPKLDVGKITGRCQVFVSSPVMPTSWTDNTYAAVSRGESIVHFAFRDNPSAADPGNVWGVQTDRLTELFQSGRLSEYLPSGQCFLFILIDTRESLPVAYMKLYKEGFFTSTGRDDQYIFQSKFCKLEFHSYIMRTDPIPAAPSSMSQNKLFFSQRNIYGPVPRNKCAFGSVKDCNECKGVKTVTGELFR